MANQRKIEVFSAGCAVCNDAAALVKSLACDSCDVEILDMSQDTVAERARGYGIKSVPAVVIDGKLADCCANRGLNEESLRNAGIGKSR